MDQFRTSAEAMELLRNRRRLRDLLMRAAWEVVHNREMYTDAERQTAAGFLRVKTAQVINNEWPILQIRQIAAGRNSYRRSGGRAP